MRIYYLLSRLLSPFVALAFYVYSHLFKVPRVRVVIRNEDGDVLFLQTWPATDMWSLPGGGVERGERPEAAASREVREETGVVIPPAEMEYRMTLKRHGHDEPVFTAVIAKGDLPPVPPNRWEVRQAAWFSPASLPRVTSDTVRIVTEVAEKR